MSKWIGECPSDDKKIWRYMDFARLISLLYKKALFFARADGLDDPFEGSFPKANVKEGRYVITTELGGLQPLSALHRKFVRLTVVNSWHLNDHESDAMWKIYLKVVKG